MIQTVTGREKSLPVLPAIKSAWKSTIEEFDKGKSNRIMDYVDFVTTGSFEGELKSVNYGLFH